MVEVVSYPAYPIVQATSKNTFVLDKLYLIKGIWIPKGYESNGDYKLADNLFEEVLFEIEASWRTKAMARAVRLYHRIRYGV